MIRTNLIEQIGRQFQKVADITQRIYYTTSKNEQESTEFSTDSEDIYLAHKNIVSIDMRIFTNFPYLKRINLYGNEIEWLSLLGLENCEYIEELEISNNKLKRIDLSPLMKCTRFEVLNLSHNSLENIDLFQISGHQSLKKIHLRSNRISEFSFEPLEEISSLAELVLDGNQLEYINLGPLSKCQQFLHLDLGNNLIRKIDLSPLRHHPSLRYLSLSQNKLESIELQHLSEVESLETLYLSYNRLRSLDLYHLQNCRLLKRVELQQNELKEIDITPLYYCPNLSELSVDNDILLWAYPEVRNLGYIPRGIRYCIEHHERDFIYMTSGTEKQQKPKKRVTKEKELPPFINPSDFSGLMYALVMEINDSFRARCFVCTAFLSRKLMENLVVSVLTRKYGKDQPELYKVKDKSGNYIRTKSFEIILRKFWSVFQTELAQFAPLTRGPRLDSLKENMFRLKNEFNIDAHELGSFRDEKSLLAVRDDLDSIIKFLMHVEKQIK